MKDELIVNGKDAYTEWGVNMGEGFLDALGEPAGLKEYVTNASRQKDGTDYCATIPKIEERQVTLTFTITGAAPADFEAKKRAFFEEMYKGDVTLKVPLVGNEVYRLKYKASSGAYAQNRWRTFCKVGMKFTEPNPRNRT